MSKDETISRTLLNAAASSVIPALASGIILMGANYLSSPNGSVSIGEALKI